MICKTESDKIKSEMQPFNKINFSPMWNLKPLNTVRTDNNAEISSKWFKKGVSIIEVEVSDLFNCLHENQAKVFSEKKLYGVEEQEEWKISEILKFWSSGKELSPPVIIIPDTELGNPENENVLDIRDGRHRFNVAIFLGAKNIPIIVPSIQLRRIKSLLKGN